MGAFDAARRLREESLDPSVWSNGPGDRYAAHEHSYDKVIVVERGSIQFEMPATGGAFDLGPGDRLELPAATTHGATVGEAGATCLEAHLPTGTFGRVRQRAAGTW